MKLHQKYEDRKSSASTFFLIGGFLTIYALLCWLDILSVPGSGYSRYWNQTVLTALGIGCLIIAINTHRTAKAMTGELAEREQQTKTMISWFLNSYTKEDIDSQLDSEFQELAEEERSLKRFDLIQDLLITNYDLPDQSYVDELCEEIYGKLFEL